MQSVNKIAIVIIVYNIDSLILRQVECIERFCKDSYDIIIEYHAKRLAIEYIKTFSSDKNGSESHVFACNLSYQKLRNRYDYFLYLDHDNFPIRELSILNILKDKAMAGLGQKKSRLYYWPGCVMWNDTKFKNNIIDFSCNNKLGLDTGGNLYKAIESIGEDNCVFFNEHYRGNPYFKKGFYNFYATINDGMFMHFINGSNWNPTDKNEERINSLINILDGLLSRNNI